MQDPLEQDLLQLEPLEQLLEDQTEKKVVGLEIPTGRVVVRYSKGQLLVIASRRRSQQSLLMQDHRRVRLYHAPDLDL